MLRRGFRLLAVLALTLGTFSGGTAAAAGKVDVTGTNDGAAFKIDIPAEWNGTLVLYSHGYVPPCNPADPKCNPPGDVGDPLTGQYLLNHGYALAGSAYSSTGWAIKDALHDQIALLNYFETTYGEPERTIAWGHSLGGMITAGLVQRNPERFAGALPMCGVLAGAVGVWNSALDTEFAFKTLLAPSDSKLRLVHIADPQGNLFLAETLLAAAQATPQGRAKLALVAAIGDAPGWFVPGSPEPLATDFAAREVNQLLWNQRVDFPFLFALRAEMEQRAGGNPSWNTGVNYRQLLDQSVNKDEVLALYAVTPGVNLDHDLATLAATPRIAADRPAMRYLTRNIVFNGEFDIPELTLHTTGDGLVLNQDEQAYASIADNPDVLRQTFVHRAGHCRFTPAETIAAFNALIQRIDTHRWSGVSPAELNAAAAELGAPYNIAEPAYIPFTPTAFPRPFSLKEGERNHEE
jgi:pimeloyl-ACP methyl ester carboxylesterase